MPFDREFRRGRGVFAYHVTPKPTSREADALCRVMLHAGTDSSRSGKANAGQD